MRKSLMIKEFSLTLLLFLAVTGMLIYPHSAAAIDLRPNTIIDDNTIMLSDIFSGLPSEKDKVLGPAPLPGKDMVLNARTLLRIAAALDLPWRPAHAGEQIVLSRAATVINHSMMEDALSIALEEKGYDGSYDIAFNGPFSDMILPMNENASVEVVSLNLNKSQNRFDAKLVAPSKDNPIRTTHVSGSVFRLVDVPVLRDVMRSGMVIGKRDIDYVPMRERDIKHDMVINANELIGMTPRRIAYQGEPIKVNQIEAPQIVGRGDFVTMVYANKGMTLTAQGKALENGAKGDIIRVSNANTSQTLEAIVTAEREVQVQDF